MLLARPISHKALNTWISSKFSTLYWICLLFTFLILVGVELTFCTVVTILECYNLFSGVKLSIKSFYFKFMSILSKVRFICLL